ncbi:MAG: hypothetical protein FD167_490, partial [bacterium]
KAHWIDAACVGSSTRVKLDINKVNPLQIKATGHGTRQMCLMDKFGFPRTKAKAGKKFFGFQTGDMVKALVTSGKKIGAYTGKVAVRASGFFNITFGKTTIQGINHKYCKLLFACDGYSYSFKKGDGDSSPASHTGVSSPKKDETMKQATLGRSLNVDFFGTMKSITVLSLIIATLIILP